MEFVEFVVDFPSSGDHAYCPAARAELRRLPAEDVDFARTFWAACLGRWGSFVYDCYGVLREGTADERR